MAEQNEQRLLAAARGGSMEALGALYERHAEMVHRVAYRFVQSESDAEEVVQDVFLGLPRALQRYRERGRFEPWLRRIAACTAIDRARRRERRGEEPLPEGSEGKPATADSDPSPATGPPGTVGEADPIRRLALRRALRGLPVPLREGFLLKEVEGYSHAEIGELLGISPAASAKRLSRARRRLLEVLGESP